MIKKLYTIGDSWTYGDELENAKYTVKDGIRDGRLCKSTSWFKRLINKRGN